MLAAVIAASTQSRVAVGPRAGQRVRRMGSFGEPGEKLRLSGALCAELGGFSLQANVFIEPGRIEKLERLCRYVARPPVAESRLIRCENGDIDYGLKTPWSDSHREARGAHSTAQDPHDVLSRRPGATPPDEVQDRARSETERRRQGGKAPQHLPPNDLGRVPEAGLSDRSFRLPGLWRQGQVHCRRDEARGRGQDSRLPRTFECTAAVGATARAAASDPRVLIP